MNRLLLVSLIATTAALILIVISSTEDPLPVTEAAAKLQEAWADHHTVV